ncbi:MAG: ATP-binding protein, partial [Bullifex sp.]
SDSVPFDRDTTDIPYVKSDFSSLHAVYKEKTGEELTDRALMSIGFFDENNNLRKGAMLFSDDYKGERTEITCTKWTGVDKGGDIILAQKNFSGNIFSTISSALGFIEAHSANGFRKEDTGRTEYISYPKRSVFEGLVNAVAHRNYYMTGTQIEVNIFIDRLEITSPGALMGYPEIRKEKNIARIIPRRRNELISSVLVYCRYMESKGSGFDKIEADYRGRGDKWSPYISSDSSSFTLVLPDLCYAGGVIDESSIPEVYTEMDTGGKNDRKILSFCYSASKSAAEIAEYIGISPSTYFRKNILLRLVEGGYLIEDSSSSPALYRSSSDKVHIV